MLGFIVCLILTGVVSVTMGVSEVTGDGFGVSGVKLTEAAGRGAGASADEDQDVEHAKDVEDAEPMEEEEVEEEEDGDDDEEEEEDDDDDISVSGGRGGKKGGEEDEEDGDDDDVEEVAPARKAPKRKSISNDARSKYCSCGCVIGSSDDVVCCYHGSQLTVYCVYR